MFAFFFLLLLLVFIIIIIIIIISSSSSSFVCVEVLWPSQPNGVMSNAVSLPNHTFISRGSSSSSSSSSSRSSIGIVNKPM